LLVFSIQNHWSDSDKKIHNQIGIEPMHTGLAFNRISSYLTVILSLLISGCSFIYKTTAPTQVKSAERAIQNQNFTRAAELYQSHLINKPKDYRAQARLGYVWYELGDMVAARENLGRAIQNGNTSSADAFFYYAKALHGTQQFGEAADQYKNFLKTSSKKDIRRSEVIDELKRCHAGIKLSRMKSKVIVDNAGKTINSAFNEVRPILSPTNTERLYFSSNRPIHDSFNAANSFNMYGTSRSEGIWSLPQLFLDKYQTYQNEELQAINSNGSALLFTRESEDGSAEWFVDSFGLHQTHPSKLLAPIFPENGDRDFCFLNDSVIVFSSLRKGGNGGYDLYFTVRVGTDWSEPQNMGSEVNSNFDETSPFVSEDGAHLFFSSNRSESIGGFDFFKSVWSGKNKKWSTPENMGIPVNSPGNEIHFNLSSDHRRIYFASDRFGGEGGYDIYSGVLRESIPEVMLPEGPFYMHHKHTFAAIKSAEKLPGFSEQIKVQESPQNSIETVTVETLYFRESDQSISGINATRLNTIAEALVANPEIIVELRSHLPADGNRTFMIYSSIEQADWVFNYLLGKGVSESQIIIKGLGDQYPAALTEVDGKTNPSAAYHNRRVEMILHNLPKNLTAKYVHAEISPFLTNAASGRYHEKMRGLSYKIQFVSLRSMYSGNLMDVLQDAAIERQGGSLIMQYNVGLHKTLQSAIATLEEVKNSGFNDAFVVVYIDGVRKTRSEVIPALVIDYPDLQNYLKFTE